MNLKDLINDEQLLDICLTLLSFDDESYFGGPAGMIVTARAAQELSKEGGDFTEDEITARINELIVSKVLERLVKEGEVEVDVTGDETLYRKINRYESET